MKTIFFLLFTMLCYSQQNNVYLVYMPKINQYGISIDNTLKKYGTLDKDKIQQTFQLTSFLAMPNTDYALLYIEPLLKDLTIFNTMKTNNVLKLYQTNKMITIKNRGGGEDLTLQTSTWFKLPDNIYRVYSSSK